MYTMLEPILWSLLGILIGVYTYHLFVKKVLAPFEEMEAKILKGDFMVNWEINPKEYKDLEKELGGQGIVVMSDLLSFHEKMETWTRGNSKHLKYAILHLWDHLDTKEQFVAQFYYDNYPLKKTFEII